MDESITAEEKKQNRPKPPRSLGRIAGEIRGGMATGLAVALLVAMRRKSARTLNLRAVFMI